MIVIIDYKMGNVGSIQNMLRKIGHDSIISSSADDINKAHHLILPGVGAFDNGMKSLQERNLIPLIKKRVLDQKIPLLGICLGMQLLTEKSEEGEMPGLGFIKGSTEKFRFDTRQNLKIPHMGWNNVSIKKKSPLFKQLEQDARFYFVHSYYVRCANNEDSVTETIYGINFCSSLQKSNIFGVQFHPEKSHKYGMRLLENFIAIHP